MRFAITIETEDGKKLVLDSVDDTSVNGTIRTTSAPLANGDTIIDHAFREGKTIDLSGEYSLNGSQYTTFDGERPMNLTAFEEEFERIQKECVRCTLYKISYANEAVGFRFMKRDNLILKSLRWTEKINSVSFSLSFAEVLLANVITYVEDPEDEWLPYLSEPESRSFSDEFVDWNQITQMIIQIGRDQKLWSDDFLNYAKSKANELVIPGIALVGGILAVSIGAVLASNPVGWVVGGLIAVGYGAYKLVSWFVGLFKRTNENKKKEQYFFKYDKDNPSLNESELKKFETFLDSIINTLKSNLENDFMLYTVGKSEEAQEGEVENTWKQAKNFESVLTVGSSYVVLSFAKSNTLDRWIVSVSSNNKEFINSGDNYKDISTCPTNYGELKTSDQLGEINGYHIFVFAPEDENKLKDLASYFILISSKKPEDIQSQIETEIKKYLTEYKM